MVGEPVIGARWSIVRGVAAYGAASTLSLYLLVKVVWVLAALVGNGPDGFDVSATDWVILNSVTVGMAATGIALALGLTQPWGRRIPAAPPLFVAWVGAGFLVPLLPYLVLSGVLAGSDSGESGGRDVMPTWEGLFVSIGVGGMALGLVIALPIYLLERFPHTFLGRLDDGRARPARNLLAVWAALVVSCVLGVLWLSWAFGAGFGLDPAHRDLLDSNARLLLGIWGVGAMVAAWSVHLLSRRQPARLRRWIPLTLAFAASGSLFAWNAWKLAAALLGPGDYTTPEYFVVALTEYVLAIGAGVTLLTALLRTRRSVPARTSV